MSWPLTFAAPAMLWSLLALLPLLAVYLLKVRPRRRPTTAFFLWEKIFHERKANRLLHRLRSLWSLLIMAAAFAAIALALADPRWTDDERQDLLILIDNSASMQTAEAGGARLDLAKEKARDLARALDGVQRAAVATVADRLRYQSHLTDNPRELLAAIDKIEPTFEVFRAAALPRETGNSTPDTTDTTDVEAGESDENSNAENPRLADGRRVLLITDGVLAGAAAHPPPPPRGGLYSGDAGGGGRPGYTGSSPLPGPPHQGEGASVWGRASEVLPNGVELILVGTEQPNVGLVAADLQFVPGAADQMSFYYQVASTAEEAVEVDLVLSRELETGQRQLAKVIPLTVEPGTNPPQVLTVEGAEPGRWVAELDVESVGAGDALAADNTAWLVARRPPPIPMAVASDDRYFFENSVQAFEIGGGALALVESDAQVTLAKGGAAAPRVIVFQPEGESPWWSELGDEPGEGELEVGAVKVLVEDHPVLRHIDPLSINFVGARRLSAPQGSQVLVEGDDGTPLIYAANRSGEAAVVVNLDPVASEFYFSAWFPVLVHSAAKHLAGREDALLAVYGPGDSVRLPGAGDAFDGKLQPPTGEETPLAGPHVGNLAEPGFYRVASGEKSWLLACSLLSQKETMITAQREAPPPAALATGGPPGGWFIVLALLAVTAESVLYHLRKVG